MRHSYKAHSKKHAKHAKHGKKAGRKYSIHNPDWKIVAIGAGLGVAAVAGGVYAQQKVETLRSHWYALPLVMAAGSAAALAYKMPTVAIALAAGAGVFGYVGYQADQGKEVNLATANKDTKGYTEAGAMLGMRRDSGLYERGAGAIIGNAAPMLRASQDAGAILGPNAANFRRAQGAGMFADAGGIAGLAAESI